MAYDNVKVKPRQTVTQSSSQTKELGIVTNVPMGDWSATAQYKKLNIVRSHEASYQAKKDNQGVEPTVTTGWQEVWQAVAYDGGAVNPKGTYPDMTVGNATNAQNDGAGENIAEQFADINAKIPSTASAENQLADKAFVNSSINAMAAFYITSNTQGDAFPTRAALLGATTFYSGGETRVPTQNDYAIVRADESQPQSVDGSYPTTRYSYQGGTYPGGQWDFQYIVNNTSLTQAQVNAINSGITKEIVDTIGKGNVLSVNGETGAVTITPAKIGALTLKDLVDLLYPVGGGERYIQFPNAQTPAQKFPGTSWEIDTEFDGYTLVGGNGTDLGDTGGTTTHTHAAGSLFAKLGFSTSSKLMHFTAIDSEGWDVQYDRTLNITETTPIDEFYEGIALGGNTTEESNMPPFIIVNFWKRTA